MQVFDSLQEAHERSDKFMTFVGAVLNQSNILAYLWKYFISIAYRWNSIFLIILAIWYAKSNLETLHHI